MDLDKPDAGDLLAIGRAVLLEEILPQLPAAQRYSALMLANALAMSGREYNLSESDRAAVEKAAARVYEESDRVNLEHNLAADIRSGKLAVENPRLRELLLQQTLLRLRLSNPKYLRTYALE